MKLRKQFQMMNELSLMPDLLIRGAKNPKLEQSVNIIDQRMGSRTILFTDMPKMADHTVQTLSKRYPGKIHAVGLAATIDLWQNGKRIMQYKPNAYIAPDGTKFKKDDWKVYILKYMVAANPEVMTCTLTSTYSLGHNLQAFNTVIHLDRDAWSQQTMEQRTARAYRTGQDSSVLEVTLDTVYANRRNKTDATLDEIMSAVQKMEGDMFQQIVVKSQAEALGKDFREMPQTSAMFYDLNRKLMKMQLSPYVATMGE